MTEHRPAHPLLRIRNLQKTYGDRRLGQVRALEAVDLTVDPGELLCIIGPTGCGKTTLLNLVAGLEAPDAGHIERNGGLGPRGNVPCVFQHYTLFPWRSVARNVEFGLQMQGMPRAQRRRIAGQLLDRVGLADFRRAMPHELSGGMRQRAAIAQALAVGSELLLMDEPFGALDDATRGELQDVLIDIWRERKMTVLFVTHNIDEAIYLGTRIVAMSPRPGRIVERIPIDLPRPRDRLSPRFSDLFLRVRRTLAGRVA